MTPMTPTSFWFPNSFQIQSGSETSGTWQEGGDERSVEVVMDGAEETRQQTVIGHRVDHSGQREHRSWKQQSMFIQACGSDPNSPKWIQVRFFILVIISLPGT